MNSRSWWGWGTTDRALPDDECGAPAGTAARPGYDRQRPEPFAVALRAVKTALDPAGILNPGVLIDPV